MKRILTVTAALAVALTSSMAFAQGRNHGGHGGHHAGPGNRHGGFQGRYARGQRYRGDGVYLSDYRRYGYRAPPRGYRYYRSNTGDVVLAAVATGIIASVIASNH